MTFLDFRTFEVLVIRGPQLRFETYQNIYLMGEKIMKEEGERIGLHIKVVEESGTSLGSLLTRPDLSGCLYPDCHMDSAGPSHLRAGANYSGVCNLCEKRYRGETGFSAHARIEAHEKQTQANDMKNSMAQHLTTDHPAQRKNPISRDHASSHPITADKGQLCPKSFRFPNYLAFNFQNKTCLKETFNNVGIFGTWLTKGKLLRIKFYPSKHP